MSDVLHEYEVEPVPLEMGILEFIETRGKVQVYDNHRKVTCPKCGSFNVVDGPTNYPKLSCCNIVVRIQND